jgi:hypothetical protein
MSFVREPFSLFDSPLTRELLELTPPVMITGNKTPDGDTVGCATALYHFFKYFDVPAFLFFGEPVQPRYSWMLEGVKIHISSGSLWLSRPSCGSLVVVDDYPCAERLGVPLPPEGVSTIVIDHHQDNPVLKRAMEKSEPDKFLNFLTDTRPTRPQIESIIFYEDFPYNGRPTSLYWADAPSTASVLIDMQIFHPYLWCSLATDSVFFTVNNIKVSQYVTALEKGLKERNIEFTDSMVAKYQEKLTPKASIRALDALTTAQRFKYEIISSASLPSYSSEYEPVTMCLASISVSDPGSFKTILSILCRFTNIVCLYNCNSRKVSLRSDEPKFTVSDIAKQFGGGGHLYAAGCSTEYPYGNWQDLQQELKDKFYGQYDLRFVYNKDSFEK